MANILDYVDWRGDLSFEQDPFNGVDATLFSQIAMLVLDDVFLEYDKLTVYETYQVMKRNGIKKYQTMGLYIAGKIVKLLDKMAHSKRYKNLEISHYVNDTDIEEQIQFSALTIKLDDKTKCIVFSGTDDTIVGWRENFNLICVKNIPAQLESVKYVEMISQEADELYICGHSKGGNLSIFSTYEVSDETFKKIKKVYSLDGHGLTHLPTNPENIELRSKVIISLIPQSAMIGRLFNHYEKVKVVHSNAEGFFQHDTFSWEVLGNKFVIEKNGLDEDAKYIELKIKNIIADLTIEEKEEFVNVIFTAISAAQVKRIGDINRNTLLLIRSFINLDSTSQKHITKILLKLVKDKVIFKHVFVNVKEYLKERDKIKKDKKEIS